MQRLPLETRYFEAYNRDNVHLVDLSETPIERITATGIQTTAGHHDLDVIVYATGFDAITGGYDRISICGVAARRCRQVARKPQHLPRGVHQRVPEHVHGRRPTERLGVDKLPSRHRDRRQLVDRPPRTRHRTWVHAHRGRPAGRGVMGRGGRRVPTSDLFRRSKGWFTGYNSNVTATRKARCATRRTSVACPATRRGSPKSQPVATRGSPSTDRVACRPEAITFRCAGRATVARR